MLGLAEVELVHRGHQAGSARERPQQLAKLLGDVGVLEARAGDHMADTLPDLV